MSTRALRRIASDINGTVGPGQSPIIPRATLLAPCELMRAIQAHFNDLDSRRWPGKAGRAGRRARRPAKDSLDARMLTTNDLFAVLKQYEEAYPAFRALGAVPADFCALPYTREVCKLSLRQLLAAHKRRCAVVFNTHPSYRGGEHWILLWIDLNAASGFTEIAFFDSEAGGMPPNVKKLCGRLHSQASRLFKAGTLANPPRPKNQMEVVRRAHQRGGDECGVYCIYFVEQLLGGVPVDAFRGDRMRISNEQMASFRSALFPVT